eukprot:scaffold108921_cov41-Attheya_sp.AAC.3
MARGIFSTVVCASQNATRRETIPLAPETIVSMMPPMIGISVAETTWSIDDRIRRDRINLVNGNMGMDRRSIVAFCIIARFQCCGVSASSTDGCSLSKQSREAAALARSVVVLARVTSVGAALGQIALGLHLVLGQVADVGQSLLNELDGKVVEGLKVVGGVGGAFGRPSQPFHIAPDRINVLGRLGLGVRVAAPKHGAPMFLRHSHIHALDMSNVQIPIGFRRKPRPNDRTVHRRMLLHQLLRVHRPHYFPRFQRIARHRRRRRRRCLLGYLVRHRPSFLFRSLFTIRVL